MMASLLVWPHLPRLFSSRFFRVDLRSRILIHLALLALSQSA
ncbi:hypothetical protein [Candidatus Accumulibacter vicinus]|nr:hypothetical protein [Candidatus Accumulibacter vicinus]